MNQFACLTFLIAACLEIGGDAVVRTGLRGHRPLFVALGFAALGCYGIVVNLVKWDFSKLLGVYVAVFAVMAVLTGRFVFKESIPVTTWAGLALIILGGFVIQLGAK